MRDRVLDKLLNNMKRYVIKNAAKPELKKLFEDLTWEDVMDKEGLCIEFKTQGMVILRFHYAKEGNGPDEVRENLFAHLVAQGIIWITHSQADKLYTESGKKEQDEKEKIKQEMLTAVVETKDPSSWLGKILNK